ncbi:MAG TPA: hypothetical protein VEB43_13825 [Anaeromyxobacter sp.]|nr:hypothetical protein [Anaeromyxobacter sp.]
MESFVVPLNAIFLAAMLIVALLVIGLILARMYRRASKEISFVRTGFGGQ